MISHQLSVIIKIIDIPKDTEQEFVHHFFFHSPCAAGYLLFLYSPAGERLCGLCPFPFISFSSPWDARIFFIRSCRLSSNPYLIPFYVSILPRISMSLPFESWISSHHLDALVTDSVANLIPRTLSLVSCPIGNNEGRYGSGHREWQDMQFIMSLLTCHVGSVVGHSQS